MHEPLTEELWVCRTCRRPLDLHTQLDPDGNIINYKWMHTHLDRIQPETHPPQPVRANDTGGEIVGTCDFCSQPHPTWIYPCKSFNLPNPTCQGAGYGSVGDWGACDTCHNLIQKGLWPQITQRAIKHQPKQLQPTAKRWVTQLHRAFRNNQTGQPHPTHHTPPPTTHSN